jgi:TDG/mug DNA glycosylase family protein
MLSHSGNTSIETNQTLPDRIGPGIRLLFVGINPSVRSTKLGHHFAGKGNRFWQLLFDAGFVPELLTFEDDVLLPKWGYGLTNIVARPTPSMADLSMEDYVVGGVQLRRLVRCCRPASVVLVGITVYRVLFSVPKGPVALGVSIREFAGANVFVVPNPSGRNAHYRYEDMRVAYERLRHSVGN